MDALARVLPLQPDEQFRAEFNDRLSEIPRGDDYDESFDAPWIQGRFSDDDNGPDHLETTHGWYALAVLVDPDLGVLPFAKEEHERVAVYRTADVILRALDGERLDDDEWEIAASMDDLPEGEDWSHVRCAAMCAAWMTLFRGGPTEFLIHGAAQLWEGRPLPGNARAYFRPDGLLSRVGHAAWNAFGDAIQRVTRNFPKGNRDHYFAQARWILQLMDINWKPEDDAERAMLHKLLGGDLSDLSDYLELLKREWIEPDIIAQLPATFQRITALRATVRSAEAAACLKIAEEWAVPVRERLRKEEEERRKEEEEWERQYAEEEAALAAQEAAEAAAFRENSESFTEEPTPKRPGNQAVEITDFDDDEPQDITDFYES